MNRTVFDDLLSDVFGHIDWNGKSGDQRLTYRDVFLRSEQEFSAYNFEHANVEMLLRHFNDAETECLQLLDCKLVLPAYEQCLKANHLFNMLNARGVISVTERASYMARVRNLAKSACESWVG
ncbi:MAG: glycine--tRNA ligase subunit alpha [Gammaproteobacteria bacterium]|nr:glycine--tRNA ligase subunit alpha [Gammaproteobacteria bacterium]